MMTEERYQFLVKLAEHNKRLTLAEVRDLLSEVLDLRAAFPKTIDKVMVKPRDTVWMHEPNGQIKSYCIRIGLVDEDGYLMSVESSYSTESSALAALAKETP